MSDSPLDGWEVASTPPGWCSEPGETGELLWQPAQVPGTAAGAVGPDRDFDAEDWWFRTQFVAPGLNDGERLHLELDGIATVSEVYLNGQRLLESSSMWKAHRVDVTDLVDEENELAIVCRALRPLLEIKRRPRQRWRTRLVADSGLRWFRTMIFGRSPGYAPEPAPVGPWRPVRLSRRGPVWVESLTASPRLEGGDGVVLVRAGMQGKPGELTASIDGVRVALQALPDGTFEGELRLPKPERWWPHTHGEPVLHELALEHDYEPILTRRIGFRDLGFAANIAEAGLDLRVNGVPVFVRGAVWTPPDLVSLAPSPAELRRLLERARDAGMNMLRLVGTGTYESPDFHDLCDELGLLVWQDLMFASLDYPLSDPDFRATVEEEAREIISGLAGRASLAVVCGNHEVEQQPAMLGLDRDLGRDALWDEGLRRIVEDSGADCAYLPSTPLGGWVPFDPRQGIAHYYGVGGYFRSPDDVRRTGVRFAAECLPCANVPDETEFPIHDPRSKAGVLRDAGTAWQALTGWDFDDVRDFYFQWAFGLDPAVIRRSDHARYIELSRAVSGELMAEVMGEWRRQESPCRGALLLWLKDMVPGPGFGVLDHAGLPKVAYHYLRRALAPVAVWTTDESTAGIDIHVANDRPNPLRARLRVAVYQELQVPILEGEETLELPGHGAARRGVEEVLGRFIDVSWSYLFGVPQHDAVVVSLESLTDHGKLLSQAFRFPGGRPVRVDRIADPKVDAVASFGPDGPEVRLRSSKLLYCVRLRVPGFEADDDAFPLEPGRERVVGLHETEDRAELRGGALTALNLLGSARIRVVDAPETELPVRVSAEAVGP